MKVAYIHWKDAMRSADDIALADVPKLYDSHCVGVVVAETDEAVSLGVEAPRNDEWARVFLTIPRVNIVEMRVADLDKAFPKKGRKK